MKTRNFALAIILTGALGLSSCNKFLDEDPYSNEQLATFYQTEAQAIGNVNGMYRRGAIVRYGNAGSAYLGPTASISTFLTGYFTNSYENQELICQYSRLLNRQENTRIVSNTMNSIWRESYDAINIANGAIKHIPNISFTDENQKKVLIATSKFFRAFNYFYLVKTFGDIPMPLEPTEDLSNLYPERTAVAQVYQTIEADLKEAVEVLPAVTFSDNKNRITKYVAAMALANVYLQQGKFAEASTYSKMVVNSAHGLTANEDLKMKSAYNKLRTTDNLPESIYVFEFDGPINSSGWWPTYGFNSAATAVFDKYSIFERVYGPTKRFLNVYKADDLRIQPNQFFHWEYKNPNTSKVWKSDDAGVWYYVDENAVLNTGRGTKDWNIYRYAEALLIAAESSAKASNSVTAEAAGYLARIKARASTTGRTVAQITTELQGMSLNAFVEEVWTERLRELPLEFKMWDDCLRTGKFPVISPTEKGKVTYTNLVGAQNASGATFKDTDLLWPISLDELQRNPKLTQNKGYQATN